MNLQFIVKHTRCFRLHIGQGTGPIDTGPIDTRPIASDLKTTVNDELKGELRDLNYFTDLQNRKHQRSLNSVLLIIKVNVKFSLRRS
jgi:hypothetical protein